MDGAAACRHHVRMETWLWVGVGLVFVAAGVVKGVSGMGLPTLAMALLGLLMPPASAAGLMVLPSLATNLAQCLGRHAGGLLRRLWPLWLALVLSTVANPLPDLASAGATARVALGIVLLLYGVWGWFKPALPPLHELGGAAAVLAGLLAGTLTGVVTAATGVFVMPMVPYLQALRLERDAFIQALGLSFTLATLALALRLWRSGGLSTGAGEGLGLLMLLALGAAFAGLGLGTLLRRRLPAATFQRALYAVFVLLGLLMLGRAL